MYGEQDGLADRHAVARTIREEIREELKLTPRLALHQTNSREDRLGLAQAGRLFVIQPEEVDSFLLPLSVGRLPE